MGYQESLWQPEVTSKTGVRGLMMLTQRHRPGHGCSQPPGPYAEHLVAAPNTSPMIKETSCRPDISRTGPHLAGTGCLQRRRRPSGQDAREAGRKAEGLNPRQVARRERRCCRVWRRSSGTAKPNTATHAAARPVHFVQQHPSLLRHSQLGLTQPQLEGNQASRQPTCTNRRSTRRRRKEPWRRCNLKSLLPAPVKT